MFPKTWDFLYKVAPVFPVRGEQIRILSHPNEFYSELVSRIQNAQSRIILTSLYLGTGPLEQTLIQTLHKKLLSDNQNVQVRILLDANRGTRGDVNSKSLLYPLVKQCNERCSVSFYHTPDLRWPLKSLLPYRYNELVGLQHMKFYLIDNSVIISGANLSTDYFTNRQDRYMIIDNHESLSNFFDDLSKVLCTISFQLTQENTFTIDKAFGLHPFKCKKEEYVGKSRQMIYDMYNSYKQNNVRDSKQVDTWVSPLLELPPFNIKVDSSVTSLILNAAKPNSVVHLATGYFNLTQTYLDAILLKKNVQFRMLMAHPTANGFLNAKGIAGGIPAAYTILAEKFLTKVSHLRLTMHEFIRKGWTYHAKGLWYFEEESAKPQLTLIGSSNFGERSIRRDLECQLVIISTNPELQQSLYDEQKRLFDQSEPFTSETILRSPDRKPPLWVQTVIAIFKYYF